MPADFDSCVRRGGKVRTVSGPNKDHGLKEGEYVRYCFIGGTSYRGEVRKKQKNNMSTPMPLANRAYHEVTINAEQDGKIETVKWNGSDHLVVPVIMLVEGVLHSSNADHPALALASEFGIFPQSWDGRPVVFSHPTQNGSAVSANQPDLWENEVIGYLFNTGMKDKKKLRSFMYLSKKKTPKEILQAFEAKKTVEVSTGLWSLEEKTSGDWQGKSYDTVWRNIVPDHLAVLPLNSVGACSVEDGCGAPRTNESEANVDPKITTTNVTNPNQEQPCTECEEMLRENLGKSLDSFLNNIVVLDPSTGLKANEVSDVDKRLAISAALGEAYPTGWCNIMALFVSEVVYTHFDPMEYKFSLYKRSYTVADGGPVTLGSDVTEVRPETKFVPLVIAVEQPATTEGSDMSQNQQQPAAPAAQPAANAAQPAATPAPQAATPTQPAAAPAPQASAAQPAAPAPTPAEPKIAVTFDELKAQASPELRAQLEGMIKAQEDRRNALVANLKDKIGLSDDELKAMPMAQLEKMSAKINGGQQPAQPAQPVDYSGGAGAPAPAANAGESNFTPPTKVFEEGFSVSVGAEKGKSLPAQKAA